VRAAARLAALALLLSGAAAAQPVVAPPPQPGAIPLRTGGVAGGQPEELWSRTGNRYSLRNVTQATLTPVLPAPGTATGAGVVVAPGGAFRTLSIDSEGFEIARWLADHGIAAFVLKYRLVPTSPDLPAFAREMKGVMTSAVAAPGRPSQLPTPPFAVEDGAAALRLVRDQAATFGVDPTRVGMMGFSAGARMTVAVALQATPETMPAFIAPIYPPMEGVTVPATAPPMFVALAADDPLFGRAGYGLIDSWAQARKKVEFHLFQRGGHGFGSGMTGTTSTGWLEQFHRWLDMNGLLKPRG
jgi:acetyl esterase/lipase